jgi:hypothetical protein
VIELRLPWMLLGFADPSRRRRVSTEKRRATVRWHERRKRGFDAVAAAFAQASS